MREACVLIGDGFRPLYWHKPTSTTSVSIPDSHDLWEMIWKIRDKLDGIAHSHPGSGIPSPSNEDLTTFSAIERGLGRRLIWWITSSNQGIALVWKGPELYDYKSYVCSEPWMDDLRAISEGE